MKKISGQNLNIDFIYQFLTTENADRLYAALEGSIDWKQTKEGKIYNRRLAKIYGDPNLTYDISLSDQQGSYKSLSRETIPWIEPLIPIRDMLSSYTKETYNYCVIQRYPDGHSGIKPHRDKELIYGSSICGISLGATRILQMTYFDKKIDIELSHGSLYILKPPTNDYWAHSIIKDENCHDCRLSLTFRKIG